MASVSPTRNTPLVMSTIDTAALSGAILARRQLIGTGYRYGRNSGTLAGLRHCAKQAGVSHSAFDRAAAGVTPSLDTYVLLCRWLQVPLSSFVHPEHLTAAT